MDTFLTIWDHVLAIVNLMALGAFVHVVYPVIRHRRKLTRAEVFVSAGLLLAILHFLPYLLLGLMDTYAIIIYFPAKVLCRIYGPSPTPLILKTAYLLWKILIALLLGTGLAMTIRSKRKVHTASG